MPQNLQPDIIRETLLSEYEKLENRHNDRNQIYANIIALKSEFGITDFHTPLYVDVKQWIKFAYKDCDSMDFGYDMPRFDAFDSVIKDFTPDKQIALYSCFIRTANLYGYDISAAETALQKAKIDRLRVSRNHLGYFCHQVVSNNWCLFSLILLILVVPCLIMLNAPCDGMAWFEKSLQNLSGNRYLNIFANALIILFDIDTDTPVITPLNFGGVAAYCLGKLFFLFFIANFVYQKIIDYFARLSYE